MSPDDLSGLEHPPLQGLWRDDGASTLLAAAATIVLGCGVFIAARCSSAPAGRAALMTLFTITVWIAVAAAPLAAGATTRLGALVRGGILADASAVVLIVVVIAGGGQLPWWAAVKVYLLWAGLAVTLALVIPLGRGRLIVALAATVMAVAAISSRFWLGGLLSVWTTDSGPPSAAMHVLAAVDVLSGVADAASSAKTFVWAEQPVMYDLTRAGQDYPTCALAWWAPALTWWVAAAALAGWIAARRSVGRFLHGT